MFWSRKQAVLRRAGVVRTGLTTANVEGFASTYSSGYLATYVDYGPTTAYGTTAHEQRTFDTSIGSSLFSVPLTGLPTTPATKTHYAIRLNTTAGDVQTGDRIFWSVTNPVVASANARPTGPASAQILGAVRLYAATAGTVTVEYGRTPDLTGGTRQQVVTNPTGGAGANAYSLELANLEPGATYYYRVSIQVRPDGVQPEASVPFDAAPVRTFTTPAR